METCKNCKKEVAVEKSVCNVCDYPIMGTEQEQASFIARQVTQKSDVLESIERLKKSRLVLFGLGAIYMVAPFTPLIASTSISVMVFSIVLGLIFIGFAFLTYKKPLMAIGIPLGMTLLYYLALLLINPALLWTGVVWKLLVLMGLGYGFLSIRKSNRILKENKYLATVLGFENVK